MKNYSLAIIIFLLILPCTFIDAQEVRRCGTWEYLQWQQQKDPSTMQRWNDSKVAAQQWLEKNPVTTRTTITIPVVVHIVYNTESQNISDAQVRSQIEVLNNDFNLSNTDTSKIPPVWKSIASSLPVHFCLASYDPDGNPTSGIERIQTSTTNFDYSDNSLKHTNQGGANGWPSDSYLNIWVCNLSGGVLGYTTMPGTSPLKEDGIVVRYNAFGRQCGMNPPFNLGRTATHEIGHWLGLVHTWGDDGGGCFGSDDMADTPNQDSATYGCHTFPLFDHCSPNGAGIMFMNYMDYSDDACLYMFTKDQTQEMLAVLNTSRASIQNSFAGCQPLYHLDAALSGVAAPDDTLKQQSFLPKVQLSNRGSEGINSVSIDYIVDGQAIKTFFFNGDLPPGESTIISLQTYFTGEYGHSFTAWCYNPNQSVDEYPFNDTICNTFYVESSIDKNTLSVSPNPASDKISLLIQNPSASEVHLNIVNELGQVVSDETVTLLNSFTISLDVSGFSSGIYFIYAHIGYYYVTQKVLVIKN